MLKIDVTMHVTATLERIEYDLLAINEQVKCSIYFKLIHAYFCRNYSKI